MPYTVWQLTECLSVFIILASEIEFTAIAKKTFRRTKFPRMTTAQQYITERKPLLLIPPYASMPSYMTEFQSSPVRI